MKRTKCIWLVLFINLSIFFLQGCMDIYLDIGKSIVPPQNKRIPIKGTWKVENYRVKEEKALNHDDTSDNWLGKTAIFDEDSVVFGEENCVNPEYKMKNVDARDYFLYTHKMNYKDLEVTLEDVDVISITSNEKHFYDFIRIQENELVVYIDDRFYYLTKISNETDPFIVGKDKINKIALNKESLEAEPELLRSGVVIGLRSLNEDTMEEQNKKGPFGQAVYRTLWISARNRKLYPILENPHLLVPRKSGFWTVGINREIREGYVIDEIYAHPMEKHIKEDVTVKKYNMFSQDQKVQKEKNTYMNIFRNILFVGNDYVITEYSKTSDLMGNRYKGDRYDRIQILPIDNIENKRGMKVSDIAGEVGKDVFMNSAEAYLATLSKREVEKLSPPTENSFTLARRNGHWIMKGRLYYRKPDLENKFLAFNINMIPPYKLVHYDELHVLWNKVKEKVPEAIDVYTSPNKDLAIVITKNEIYVYTLKNNKLSNKYIEKIKLRKGESVVMAEWATGSYVEKWENILDDIAVPINN